MTSRENIIKRLNERIFQLSEEQIEDILQKYHHEERVEIMTDLLVGQDYYQYQDGDYKRMSSIKIYSKN